MGTDSKEVAEGNGNFYSSFIYVCVSTIKLGKEERKDKAIGKKVVCMLHLIF